MAAGPRHNNLSREVTRTCFCARCFVCRPPETRPNTKTRGLLKDAAPSAHRQADQAPANTTYHIRQVANEPTPAPHRTKKRKQTKTKEGSKKKRRNKRCGDPTPAHCSEQCGGTARSSEATERLYVLLTDVCPSYVHLLQTERPPSRYLFFCLFYKLVILF